MQRSYRTPKGTELPLLNLRGREYLEVKYRLVWFREDHPDWAIETELLSVNENSAYARAAIKDEHGRTIATSHKFENRKGFPDFIEKAETGSIGRALALIGYGTQFCADELDEGQRIVDAPVESQPRYDSKESAKNREESLNKPSAQTQNGEASSGRNDKASAGRREAELGERNNVKSAAPSSSSQTSLKDPGSYRIAFGKKYKGLTLKEIPRNELEGYLEWLEENASKKGLPLSEEARFLKVAVGRFLQSPNSAEQSQAKQEGKGH